MATLRPKPPHKEALEVLERLLEVVPKNEEEPPIVLDCFCGSGSTGVACVQLGLDFIRVEIPKEYATQASINSEGFTTRFLIS